MRFFFGSRVAFPRGTVLRGRPTRHDDPTSRKAEKAFRTYAPPGVLLRGGSVYMSPEQDPDAIEKLGASSSAHVVQVVPLGPVERSDVDWFDRVWSEMLADRPDLAQVERMVRAYYAGEPASASPAWEYRTREARVEGPGKAARRPNPPRRLPPPRLVRGCYGCGSMRIKEGTCEDCGRPQASRGTTRAERMHEGATQLLTAVERASSGTAGRVPRPGGRSSNPVPARAFERYAGDSVALVTTGPGATALWARAVRAAERTFRIRTERELLGCGNSGCAAMTLDGRVLKLTTEVPEVVLYRAASELGAFEGIARVDVAPVVIEVSTDEAQFGVAAYVKERLATPVRLSGEAARAVEGIGDWTHNVRRPSECVRRLAMAAKFVDPRLTGMAISLSKLLHAGYLVWDLHPDNLGARADGTIVILDGMASHATRLEPVRVEDLPGPRVLAS